jgi:hypothetical protein
LTFPLRAFSTARRAVIFSAAGHRHVIFFSIVRLADIPVLSQSDISWINDTDDVPGLLQEFTLRSSCPQG